MKSYLTIIFLLIINAMLFGQDKPSIGEKIKASIKKTDSINKQKEAEGKPIISPIIFPAYNPDAGFILGAGALLTFKTKKTDTLIQRSSLPFIASYSTEKQLFLSLPLTSFWLKDKLRVNWHLWVKDKPDNYYGVGYQKANSTPLSDSTTKYSSLAWQFMPIIRTKVAKNIFIGALFDVNSNYARELNPKMAADEHIVKQGSKIFNTGLGWSAQYDSRDQTVNAYKGFQIGLVGVYFSKSFGGNKSYQAHIIDYRHYITLGKPGHTLAWQLKFRFGQGDTPWSDMAKTGGGSALRGYAENKFRDVSMAYTIVEYRHMFYKKNGEMSKHGMVAFAGLGSISPENFKYTYFMPNVGLGYRFAIQTRMNLRFDLGAGQNEAMGFYFGFNEAF